MSNVFGKLAALLPFEVFEQNLADGWETEGWTVNPAAGQIIADSGQLPAGKYDFTVVVTVNTNASTAPFQLEHRNAGNTATLKYQRITGLNSLLIVLPVKGYSLLENERLRVEVMAAWTGGVQVSIFYVRRR